MSFQVTGIGEIVWDVFSSHKRLGGAPYNFAYHCAQLGADAFPVSCVGKDALGAEIRNNASAAGMDVSCLQENEIFPTGTVQVILNDGKPSYEICKNAAWDHLVFTPELAALSAQVDAVCFGTLGQRSTQARETIGSVVKACPDSALKIFDINLRQNFFSEEVIRESLELANILKLSDEELPVLKEIFGLTGNPAEQLVQLTLRFSLRLAAYTRGAGGSLLISENESSDHPGCCGPVVDSVGAGDSFTATLCMGLLQKRPLDEINEVANRVATFVCSQKGATPVLPNELIQGASYADA